MKFINKISVFLLWSGFILITDLHAQADYYPDDFLSISFHKDRRDQLRIKMPPNSVAIFFANAFRTRSADVDFPYHQDPDFYYLSGYREANAVLLIFKDFQQADNMKDYNEIIFVQPNNAWEELWNGKRLGIDGVKEKLGFETVFANTDFQYYDPQYQKFNKVLFKPIFDDFRDTDDKGDLYDLIKYFKQKNGIENPNSTTVPQKNVNQKFDSKILEKILTGMREIKTPEELILIRKAIEISCKGQIEVMRAVEPGISERKIQGIHEFVHHLFGAEGEGYPPIIGAGNNSCTLHYEENYKPQIDSGELILMDVGAEYRGYSADITRTIPVNGIFSTDQRLIYDLVYESQEAAIKTCKAGSNFDKMENAVRDVINDGLKKLEIIKKSSESFYYMPHGVSHPVGLDVHDPGDMKALEENMVITIEPGIYIPEGSPTDPKWWKTGIRIEDDLLVKKEGCDVLSDITPRKSNDIEIMMSEQSALNPFMNQIQNENK